MRLSFSFPRSPFQSFATLCMLLILCPNLWLQFTGIFSDLVYLGHQVFHQLEKSPDSWPLLTPAGFQPETWNVIVATIYEAQSLIWTAHRNSFKSHDRPQRWMLRTSPSHRWCSQVWRSRTACLDEGCLKGDTGQFFICLITKLNNNWTWEKYYNPMKTKTQFPLTMKSS